MKVELEPEGSFEISATVFSTHITHQKKMLMAITYSSQWTPNVGTIGADQHHR
jgi:hypothetical protein